MKNGLNSEERVYMIGCGKTNNTCKEYTMKENGNNVEIYDGIEYICSYTKAQMVDFMSIGFAALV